MHLLENTLFDTQCCPVPSTLCDLSLQVQSLKLLRLNGLGGDTFTRNMMDCETRMDRWTTDLLLYENNLPFFF